MAPRSRQFIPALRFDSLTLPNGVTRDLRSRLSNADSSVKGDVDRNEGKITSESDRSGDARRAIEQSFDDLKSHQIKTYSAMQHALTLLLADLDPQTIDRDTDAEGGIAALVTSRKAKLWDAYVARWQAQVRREGGGLVDSFMLLFADCYDRDGSEMR